MNTAERYIQAINDADEAALLALFSSDADADPILRHPLGTFRGPAEIGGFYRDVVFAGKARTEITRLIAGPDVEIAQIEATSPLGEPGNRAYAVDVFELDRDGLIVALDIYYR